jgi:hypothetical protein
MTLSCVLQAIKLLGQLSSRLPDIVHLLQPNYDDSAVIIIRQGFAAVCDVMVTTLHPGDVVAHICRHDGNDAMHSGSADGKSGPCWLL